jgi:hypothetical protein
MLFKRKGWIMKLGYAAAIAMVLAFPAAGNAASQCDARSFGGQIDQTAQALRTLNRESERRFHERLEALAKQNGWSEAQKADKAAAAMDDSKLESFNSDIEELVARLDKLSATPNSEVSCARLSELKTVQQRLLAVMGQKSGFILAQLEAEGAKAAGPAYPYAQRSPASAPETQAQTPAVPQEQAQATPPATPGAPAGPGAPAAPAAVSAPGTHAVPNANDQWSVNLAQTPPPVRPQKTAAQPAPLPQRTPAPQPDTRTASLSQPPAPPALAPASGYSADEIRDVGKGVFGAFVTGDLATLVSHSFKKFGRPNAYIIGDEGGGAFLAGLRYGDGKLYTRLNGIESGPTQIYWQGPSLGADMGATGSRTLFLVYNLENSATLYQRFPGIDGSAYVAGGMGMTVYQSGNTLIVPIRTGVGLRLGASVAYLKFTERASWNPF